MTLQFGRCLAAAKFAVILWLSVFASSTAALAQLEVTPPEGFEDLEGEQTQVVDVYFEDQLLGLFKITINGSKALFVNPQTLVAQLPPSLRTPEVLSSLSGELDRNPSVVCPRGSTTANCGVLKPDVAGIVHHRESFEIYLFVNPALRIEQAEPVYLPEPSEDFDLLSYGSFMLSGGGDDNPMRITADLDTVLSVGRARLLGNLSYSDETQLRVGEAVAEVDLKDIRIISGLFWSRAALQFGRERVIGFGVSSQLDTRLDRDRLIGSPINVYLQSRGKVEILLDNRVIYASMHPAGSNSIDTSSFPQGNYNLIIRLSEAGNPTRIESRFFSKSVATPQVGNPIYFLEAGLRKPWSANTSDTDLSDSLLARFGAIRRFNQSLAAGVGFQFIGGEAETRARLAHFNKKFTLEAHGSIGTRGSRQASVQLSSTGHGELNYSLEARHVDLKHAAKFDRFSRGNSYDRLSANLSWVRDQIRLAVFANSYHSNGRNEYSISARAQYALVQRNDLSVSILADYAKTDAGNSWMTGITIRMYGSPVSAESSLGFRSTVSGLEDAGIYSIHGVSGSYDVGSGERLTGSAAYEVGPSMEIIGGNVDFDADSFGINASYLRNVQRASAIAQYSIGGSGSLIYSGDSFVPGHKATREATVLLNVSGAEHDEKFEVLVDGQIHAIISGSSKYRLILPSYRLYQLRLRARQSRPMTIVDPARTVSLYPGNVQEIEWKIARRVAVIGQLRDKFGMEISGATLRWQNEIALTDNNGYFQIELSPSARIEVQTRDGKILEITAPDFEETRDFIRIGTLIATQED